MKLNQTLSNRQCELGERELNQCTCSILNLNNTEVGTIAESETSFSGCSENI